MKTTTDKIRFMDYTSSAPARARLAQIQQQRKLMTEVFELSIRVNSMTPDTVFLHFSGHVDWLELEIHKAQFTNSTPNFSDTIKTQDNEIIKLKSWVKILKECLA